MTIDQTLQSARDHLSAGRWLEAEQLTRQALQAEPTAVAALQILGCIANRVKNWSAAEELFSRASELPGGETVDLLCDWGEAQQGAKKFELAEATFRRAVALDDQQGRPYLCLGRLFHAQQQFAPAIEALQQSVTLRGTPDEGYCELGQIHLEAGRGVEAEACLIAASQINSRNPQVYCTFGQLRRLQGRMANAKTALEYALLLKPDFPEALNQLGLVHYLEQNYTDAEFYISRAAQLVPDQPETHNHLGIVALAQGRRADALRHFSGALQLDPQHTDSMNNLATLYSGDGKTAEAIACFERVLQLRPNFVEAYNNLGLLLLQTGQLTAARQHLNRAIELRPNYADPLAHLGTLELHEGHFTAALANLRQAVSHDPNLPDAQNNLGNVHLVLGDAVAARDCFRRAMELRPKAPTAHSNYLFSQLFSGENSPEQLAALHAEFEQKHSAPLVGMWRPFDRDRNPDRRLRVGFLSAELGRHPIGHVLVSLLQAWNHEQFEVVLYSQHVSRDPLTERIIQRVSGYREVFPLDDNQLAEQIRADQIDLLIDLSGHSTNNRLLVMARRPAPVQATWLGYLSTTGLKAIDYWIGDSSLVSPDDDRHFSERVVRLPEGIACHELIADAPELNDLPARQPGQLTLGCFNHPAKLNAAVIKVWAEILRRLPEARLKLKFHGLHDPTAQQRILDLFAAQGLSHPPIEFQDRAVLRAMLAEYQTVDLALDPFPYAGGASTLLALQMGIPVVTWPQEHVASRLGLSILSQIGMTETIARSADDYVEIVVRLAHDLERLREWRRTLRDRLMQSSYGDPRRFAPALQAALRTMWRDGCRI